MLHLKYIRRVFGAGGVGGGGGGLFPFHLLMPVRGRYDERRTKIGAETFLSEQ